MKIAISGAGTGGRTLGTARRNGGHDVAFGVRNPDDPRYASLGSVDTNEVAASSAEVATLCTPWPGTQAAVQSSGDDEQVLARLLEPYALLWIHQAPRRGLGTGFGFGLLRGRA